MEVIVHTIEHYVLSSGKIPLEEWLLSLGNGRVEAVIRKRIRRLSVGNFGDCKSLGGGLFELRIHLGAGYRVYFGRKGMSCVLLLCGGDKRMQRWDIMKAKHYWLNYLEREK